MTPIITHHAKERMRQRLGITAEDAMIAWVSENIAKSIGTKQDGNKTIYLTESFEIICDGLKVVTVKPADSTNAYITKLSGIVAKEVRKMLDRHSRDLRKAEISVAEAQLSYLRAKNPKVKEIIKAKLVAAIDSKAAIDDEIMRIKKAADRYGVDASHV